MELLKSWLLRKQLKNGFIKAETECLLKQHWDSKLRPRETFAENSVWNWEIKVENWKLRALWHCWELFVHVLPQFRSEKHGKVSENVRIFILQLQQQSFGYWKSFERERILWGFMGPSGRLFHTGAATAGKDYFSLTIFCKTATIIPHFYCSASKKQGRSTFWPTNNICCQCSSSKACEISEATDAFYDWKHV